MTHETSPFPRRVPGVTSLSAAAAALVLALSAPASLRATESSRASAVAEARRADAIVTGTVSAIESRWAGKKIVSVAEFSVESTVKGAAASRLIVSFPGGRVEKPIPMAMIVTDVPTLEESEVVLLFLADSGDGTFGVSAKYAISRDPGTGKKTVAIGGRAVPVESLAIKRAALEREGREGKQKPNRR